MPRRSQYPVGFNLPIGIPGSEGLKLVSFSVIRAYAEANSFVRACISARKNELLGMEYDLVPTPDAEKAMRDDRFAHANFQERRKHALAWWARPDPDYDDFQSWFSAVLESVFVDDATALFLHPSRVPGKGAFGTDLAALEWIDGSLIRPVMGMRGQRPRPPAPAYQQYLWGVPRTDLTAVLHDADLELMADQADGEDVVPVEQYRRDQLMYLRQEVRGWTPYGYSCTEKCIIPIITLLKRQEMGLEYFTSGSMPAAFVAIGGEINATPAQAALWQTTLNALAGDTGYKQQITVLPTGSTVSPMRENPFDAALLRSIQEDIMMNFSVEAQDVGLPPGGHMSGMGGKGAGDSSENRAQKKLKPEINWLTRSLFNYVIQTIWGQTDMMWRFGGDEPVEDELKKAQSDVALVNAGVITRDEAREERKKQPFGIPGTSDPSVMTATGVVSLGLLSPADVDAEDDSRAEPGIDTESSAALEEDAETPAPEPAESPLHAASGGQDMTNAEETGQAATAQAAMASVPDLHKAAEAELGELRRYLRHGKGLRDFQAKVLSANAMKAAASGGVKAARKVVHAELWKVRKQAALTKLHAPLQQKIAGHATALKSGSTSPEAFQTGVTTALSAAYLDAFTQGATDYNPDYELDDDDQASIDARVQTQGGFLPDWAATLALGLTGDGAESDAGTMDRAGMYANTVQPTYDEGVTSSIVDDVGSDGVIVTWNGGDCALCSARDGEGITPDDDGTLSWSNGEGYPGDGGFGDEDSDALCMGGANCNCNLTYSGPDGSSIFDHSGGDPNA